jgi:hypothetical protein
MTWITSRAAFFLVSLTIGFSFSADMFNARAGSSSAPAWDFDSTAPQPDLSNSDAKEVYEAVTLMAERWNAHDLKGYLDGFWNSPKLVVVSDAQQFIGFQELHDAYVRGFGDDPKVMGFSSIKRVTVRMVRQNLALALTLWDAKFQNSPNATNGVDTTYLKRIDGKWKVISAHTTMAEL